MIRIEELYFSYGKMKVLENVNLIINKGDFTLIAGHNGSGKTTLLKILLGILKPKKGLIYIDNKNINDIFKNKKRHTPIAYINQGVINTSLPITVREVINIGYLTKNKIDNYKTEDIITKLRINNIKDKLYKNLSGGQKQKVNIARCLVQEPKIMLLDEPTSFLDYKSQIEIMNIIKELNSKYDITIIVVSHDIKLVEEYSKKIYILENGNLKELDKNINSLKYNILQNC